MASNDDSSCWPVGPHSTGTRQIPTDNGRSSSPIVTLLVGVHRHPLKTHKAILMKCGRFAAYFKGDRFRGGPTNEIELPVRYQHGIATLIQWLYTPEAAQSYKWAFKVKWDQCWVTREKEELMDGLVRDFILADLYIYDEMTDAVLDVLWSKDYPDISRRVRWRHLVRLELAGLRDSAIWDTLVSHMANAWMECDLTDPGLENDYYRKCLTWVISGGSSAPADPHCYY